MKAYLSRMIHSPGWQLAFCVLLPALLSLVLYQTKQGQLVYLSHIPQLPLPAGNTQALPQYADRLVWYVEHIGLDTQRNRYEVSGWVVDRKDGRWLRPRVVLVQQNQTSGVEIRTKMELRKDVAASMADGRVEHFGGFRAFVSAKDWPQAPGARVYLSVEHAGQRVLIDTGKNLPGGAYGQAG